MPPGTFEGESPDVLAIGRSAVPTAGIQFSAFWQQDPSVHFCARVSRLLQEKSQCSVNLSFLLSDWVFEGDGVLFSIVTVFTTIAHL